MIVNGVHKPTNITGGPPPCPHSETHPMKYCGYETNILVNDAFLMVNDG